MRVLDEDFLPFTGRVLRRTRQAILFDESGDGEGVWLPIESIRMGPATGLEGGFAVHVIEVPEWLAVDKGLI
jgi:hypothetical protein